jgi:hypothetical protein
VVQGARPRPGAAAAAGGRPLRAPASGPSSTPSPTRCGTGRRTAPCARATRAAGDLPAADRAVLRLLGPRHRRRSTRASTPAASCAGCSTGTCGDRAAPDRRARVARPRRPQLARSTCSWSAGGHRLRRRLDAASRGLSVALVEKADLAHGTSRWSSKLVHGGLRYLATGDVGLASRAPASGGILMTRTAPHLVRPLPMVVPLGRRHQPARGRAVRRGHRVGDGPAQGGPHARRTLPGPRRISATETTRLLPRVRRSGLRGGLLNWDGQLEDDARLVVALARTAASYGARIVTYAAALGRRRQRRDRPRRAHRADAAAARPRRRQRDRAPGRTGWRRRPGCARARASTSCCRPRARPPRGVDDRAGAGAAQPLRLRAAAPDGLVTSG